jgi:hypothetical protein
MGWERMLVSRAADGRSENELKRLRAYEGLIVVVLVIGAVLAFGGVVAFVLSASLGDAARVLDT